MAQTQAGECGWVGWNAGGIGALQAVLERRNALGPKYGMVFEARGCNERALKERHESAPAQVARRKGAIPLAL